MKAANINMARFLATSAFCEFDGYEKGDGDDYLFKIQENETYTDVFFFEPTFPGEPWAILILKYADSDGPSKWLQSEIDRIAETLDATVEEAWGE